MVRCIKAKILQGVRELRFDISRLSPRSFAMKRPWSERVTHPFSIILTPECDLEWDFQLRQNPEESENKRVSHLLLCDLEDRFQIEKDLRIRNQRDFERASSYREERWHFLDGHESGPFYIDFKRLFSVPLDFVYAAERLDMIHRRGYLKPPWVQHLTHRFTNFLGRVGLPDER